MGIIFNIVDDMSSLGLEYGGDSRPQQQPAEEVGAVQPVR